MFRSNAPTSRPWLGLAISVELLTAAVFLHEHPQYSTPTATGIVPSAAKAKVLASSGDDAVPTRIDIPALQVSAEVVSETTGPTGALEIPANPAVVGWWRDGSRPSATAGTTVIAGHVDTKQAGAGAFYKLERLAMGSRIQLRTATGSAISYRTTARAVYRKSSLPAELFDRAGQRRLALVTCGGPFDTATGSYRYNVVVYAVPV
jgi:sortase (surface protein transpeptidase)